MQEPSLEQEKISSLGTIVALIPLSRQKFVRYGSMTRHICLSKIDIHGISNRESCPLVRTPL